MSAVDDATHILEVEGLSAWYERDRPVLTDVSFALEAGEAVGLHDRGIVPCPSGGGFGARLGLLN